jgi:hypothetical protein
LLSGRDLYDFAELEIAVNPERKFGASTRICSRSSRSTEYRVSAYPAFAHWFSPARRAACVRVLLGTAQQKDRRLRMLFNRFVEIVCLVQTVGVRRK